MFLRHCITFTLIALLAGCAGFGSRESLQGHGDPQLWRAHKEQLSNLDGWQINGKVGIRAPVIRAVVPCSGCNAGTTTTSAWPAPGSRGGTPDRTPRRRGPEVANQGRYEAPSPEALLEEQLGWQLPVSHLVWWVRGLPAPIARAN